MTILNGLLKKLTNRGSDSSNVAKKRLKFALVYDKLEIKEEMLEDLQKDLIEVISRYFEIDRDQVMLDIERSEESSALIMNTPILAARHKKPAHNSSRM